MTLPRLTALRWWAAVAVLVCHVGPRLSPSTWWSGFGQAGVGFFFALSGVVLAWSTPDGARPMDFYRRRFARIYPATMTSGVIAAALIVAGVPGLHGGAVGALTNVTLTQAWFPDPTYPVLSYNGVTWSLSCEVFFYFCLPLLLPIARRRPGRALRAAVTCAAVTYVVDVALTIQHSEVGASIAYNMPIMRLPEFLVGMAIGLKLRAGWTPSIGPVRSSVLLVALFWVAHWVGGPAFAIVLLPGTVAVLCSAAGRDLRRRPGWSTKRLPVYLGALSFSFYLVHWLALMLLLSFGLHGWPLVVTLVALALGAAVLLHHGVELPFQRWINRRGGRNLGIEAEPEMQPAAAT